MLVVGTAVAVPARVASKPGRPGRRASDAARGRARPALLLLLLRQPVRQLRADVVDRPADVLERVAHPGGVEVLRRARLVGTKRYLEKLAEECGQLLAIPGRHKQSIEESSFDAWIKLYRPDENSVNSTVSYYLKGGLVPPDPWGNPYVYRSPGQHGTYDILSYGSDGTEGGSGSGQDITSWQR